MSARIGHLRSAGSLVFLQRSDDPIEIAEDLLVHLDDAELAAGLGRHPILAATAMILTAAAWSSAEAAHDLHPLLKTVGAW